MKPVKSSSIAKVGHNPATGVLSVLFHNGSTYDHAGVSADEAAALLNAESVGSHYNKHIRGTFKGVKQ